MNPLANHIPGATLFKTKPHQTSRQKTPREPNWIEHHTKHKKRHTNVHHITKSVSRSGSCRCRLEHLGRRMESGASTGGAKSSASPHGRQGAGGGSEIARGISGPCSRKSSGPPSGSSSDVGHSDAAPRVSVQPSTL